MTNNSESLQKARRYAFLLLKFRFRSEQELALRLRRKGYSEELVKDTVSFLKERKLLDDKVFARNWIASRLKKPFGVRRIIQELKIKGIDKKTIEEGLRETSAAYAEQEIVATLAKRRLAQLKNLEPLVARRRVYGYLIRRGFLPETVSDVLNQL